SSCAAPSPTCCRPRRPSRWSTPDHGRDWSRSPTPVTPCRAINPRSSSTCFAPSSPHDARGRRLRGRPRPGLGHRARVLSGTDQGRDRDGAGLDGVGHRRGQCRRLAHRARLRAHGGRPAPGLAALRAIRGIGRAACRGRSAVVGGAAWRVRSGGPARRELRRAVLFFGQAEDGIRGRNVTGVQTCALPIYLGPVKDATEMALVWTVWVTVAASVVASLTVLAFGLMAGGSRPAWLRFVQSARTVAAVIGCGLIVVGLLHYRDTEPSGEIHWIILGLAILVGSGVVHLWVVRTHRRTL